MRSLPPESSSLRLLVVDDDPSIRTPAEMPETTGLELAEVARGEIRRSPFCSCPDQSRKGIAVHCGCSF